MVWHANHDKEDASMKTWNSHRATKFAMLWAVACWGLPGALQAGAPAYTYDVDVNNGFLIGTITTNCDQCMLNGSDITAWTLGSTSSPQTFTAASTDPGAYAGSYLLDNVPTSLTATPSAITYNFGANGQFVFQTNKEFIIFAYSDIGAYLMGFPGQIAECAGSNDCYGEVFRGGTTVLGELKSVAAPELDAASLAGALTLLLGSLAVLRGRRGSAGS
jgi:hypothetical protein